MFHFERASYPYVVTNVSYILWYLWRFMVYKHIYLNILSRINYHDYNILIRFDLTSNWIHQI